LEATLSGGGRGGSGYDLAVTATLKLIPQARQLVGIGRDYQAMQTMLFGTPPDFNSIVDELRELETEINSLRGEGM
jgi:hypothetical protein